MKRARVLQVCPSKAQWEALLLDVLTENVVEDMESHLDDCSRCALVLAELTPATPALLKAAALEPLSAAADEGLGSSWFRSALREESTVDFLATKEMQPSPAPLLTRVGDYELIDLLGRGGMGQVYRARQVKLLREVAVKMLPSRYGRSPAAMQRLIAEAQRLAHLKHPNIVQVFDVGEQDGVPFFSMELVEGKTLAKSLRAARIEPRRAADLVRTIAGAVQAAHDAGVMHRDLKPANILLTASGDPKVTDFGLGATRDEADSGACLAGGTAEYMAPEQWTGDTELITPRTDVYGLGAILFELLTGRPPFPRDPDTTKTRNRVLCESPAAPRQIRPDVPRDLEAICLRCLEKSPDRRYSTAAALADDLNQFLGHYPVTARPIGFVQRMAYRCRRHWAPLITAMGVLAIAATIGIPYGITARSDRHAALADRAFEEGVRTANDGRVSEGLTQMRHAIDLLPSNRTTLHQYFRQSSARWEVIEPRKIGLHEHSAVVTAAVMSPAGDQVLFGDQSGSVWLWSPRERKVRNLKTQSTPSTIQSVAFDVAGKRCAASNSGGGVWVWNTLTGDEISHFRLDKFMVRTLVFLGSTEILVTGTINKDQPLRLWSIGTPVAEPMPAPTTDIGDSIVSLSSARDGNAFVAVSRTGRCWTGDPSGKISHDVTQLAGHSVSIAKFSDDGTKLHLVGYKKVIEASSNTGLMVSMMALATAQVARLPSLEPGTLVHDLAPRPDGGMSLVIERGGRSLIRNVTADSSVWEDHPADVAGTIVHVSRDGELVALSGIRSTTMRLTAVPRLRCRAASVGVSVGLGSVAVSIDSSQILTLAREVVPDAAAVTPKRVHIQLRHSESLRPFVTRVCSDDDFIPLSIARSPTQNLLALGCQESSGSAVLLCEPTRDSEIAFQQMGKHGSGVFAVAFSPDGRWLYSGCIRVGQTSAGELARWDIARREQTHLVSYPVSVKMLALSPDGSRIAVGGSDGSVMVLAADSLKWEGAPRFAAGSMITALEFSPNGNLLAIGTTKGRAIVCRVDNAQLTIETELDLPPGRVSALRFSARSDVLYAGSNSPDSGIVAWNTRLWRRIGPPVAIPGEVLDFAIAHGRSELVALTTDGRLMTNSVSDVE